MTLHPVNIELTRTAYAHMGSPCICVSGSRERFCSCGRCVRVANLNFNGASDGTQDVVYLESGKQK